MPTVEELYRNYGILADATEQVGQVGPRGLQGPPLGAGLPPHWAASPAGRALGAGTRPRPARERAAPHLGGRSRSISRAVMKWKVFLKRSEWSVLEAEFVSDLKRVGFWACAKHGRGPVAWTWEELAAAAFVPCAFGLRSRTQLWRALEARWRLRALPGD